MTYRCSACKEKQPPGTPTYRRDLDFRCDTCGPHENPSAPIPGVKWHVRMAVATIACCHCGSLIHADDLAFYQHGSHNLRCESCGVEASTT